MKQTTGTMQDKWLSNTLVLISLTKLFSLEEALDGGAVLKPTTEFQESLIKLQSYNLTRSETKENTKKLKKPVSTPFVLKKFLGHPRKGCDNAS